MASDQPVTRVSRSDILKQVPPLGSFGEELTPLQKLGFKLALTFFGYILIASIAIFWVSFGCIHLPPLPAPPTSSSDPTQYQKLVDIYKQTSDIYQQIGKSQVERATQLFQL